MQFISHLGITKNAFAASLDKTATVIQHLVDERNKPGFDLLCKVFEVYPNVSKDWLLQGTGPMLTDTDSAPQPSATVPENKDNSAVPGPVEVASKAEEAPSETPVSASPAVEPQPTVIAPPAATPPVDQPVMPVPVTPTPPTPAAIAPMASAIASASADTSWQTALYTQQMAHQLALAELRNQHLQDQQRLMQQMLDLMQRQLPR